MKVGNPDYTGDLVILKRLLERYKITSAEKIIEQATKGRGTIKATASACGAGACSNDCTHMCATCYACPDNCSLKA